MIMRRTMIKSLRLQSLLIVDKLQFKPLKSHLPLIKSRRSGGIDGKSPQHLVLFGTYRPQDMGIGKELE